MGCWSCCSSPPPRAEAAVIAVAQKDGVIVSLTDEPCRLEAVKNLPGRALWAEKGRDFF